MAYVRSFIRIVVGWWQTWWSQRSPATRDLPRYIWRAIGNFRRHGGRQAAALAYYSVFSVFPLSLLLAVAISSILGPTVAQEQVSSGLEFFLPPSAIELLQTNVSAALEQSQSFGIVALLGLAWSALGLFSNISSSLDSIFQVPARRSLWRQRLLAFTMTVILIVLVIASFVTSGILLLLTAAVGGSSFWLSIATLIFPFGLDIVIFALLFRYVPARRVSWDAVWPSAIFGAVGWELAKTGFQWFLSSLVYISVVYGGIAAVIILMLWAYLIASIFLLSAELCAELDAWLGAHREPETMYIETDIPRLPPEV
jgi:membrane protein